MTKALICTTTSRGHQRSYVYRLYGDPDHYASQFGNETRFDHSLPIWENWIFFQGVDFLHSMSIDNNEQRIYFGNNLHERLEYGLFIYNNSTRTKFFDFMPETNQVSLF